MIMITQQDIARIQVDAGLAATMQSALLAGNEEAATSAALVLLATSPEEVAREACAEELSIRLMVHEIASSLMTDLIFSDSHDGTFWRRLMLPTGGGVLGYPIWMGNIKWIRLFGGEPPNPDSHTLCVEDLRSRSLVAQAKMLGRFCVTHDAATALDFSKLADALDPRLMPVFTSWLLGTYMQSPHHMVSDLVASNQAAGMDSFLARWKKKPLKQAASAMELTTSFLVAYREDIDVRGSVQAIRGNLMRDLFTSVRPPPAEHGAQEIRDELQPLLTTDAALLCPNWRDDHVAYRCLAGAAEAMRKQGSLAIQVHANGSPIRDLRAKSWQDQTVAVNLSPNSHYLLELGRVANEIAAANLDFLFYPEVTPSDCTAFFATQRLARVQAVGYGFPLTTGSPHMDYFIGGSEVELDSSEYTEQLVLLPGLGVSTTPPPLCEWERTRGYDDGEIRIATIASHQKLGANLLRAWEAILGDRPHASMDLFPALTPNQANALLPAMATHLKDASIDLHPRVKRQDILRSICEADLYLDTFPYGGFNSLVEVLVAGCPVVTLEGKRARNRFGAAMLRRLELPEFLIAKTPAEFVTAARRLIDDPGLRMEIRAQIGSRERVLALLADDDIHEHFAAAVEWMRERGPSTGKNQRSRAPVLICAGEKPQLLTA